MTVIWFAEPKFPSDANDAAPTAAPPPQQGAPATQLGKAVLNVVRRHAEAPKQPDGRAQLERRALSSRCSGRNVPRGEGPGLKFNPGLLVLLLQFTEVWYLCLRTQSQAIATVTFCQGTDPDVRRHPIDENRGDASDLHGRRQPIYCNRCCSARVSDVRDYLCIFQCFRACRCVAGRERGAINLVSDFGRGV